MNTARTLGGFELLSVLGRGGMGVVYKARDLNLDRFVALKTMAESVASDPRSLARFKNEAQVCSRIQHPNVVSIHSFGVDGQTPYLVMELLRGESLGTLLRGGPPGYQAASDIFLGVCAGLLAVHRAGIVHRDLKPHNVFLTRTWLGQTAKLLDFGISKTRDGLDMTNDGEIPGTPYYLAPEQVIAGKVVDARCDQFAIGVMLYECVTGRTPHAGKSVSEHLRLLSQGEIVRPGTLAPELPPAFEMLVMQALAPNPAGRFESIHAFGRALLPFASMGAQRRWSEHYTTINVESLDPGLSLPVRIKDTGLPLAVDPEATLVDEDSEGDVGARAGNPDRAEPICHAPVPQLRVDTGGARPIPHAPMDTPPTMMERPAPPRDPLAPGGTRLLKEEANAAIDVLPPTHTMIRPAPAVDVHSGQARPQKHQARRPFTGSTAQALRWTILFLLVAVAATTSVWLAGF